MPCLFDAFSFHPTLGRWIRKLYRRLVQHHTRHAALLSARPSTVTVSYPENAVARKSVHRYIATLCQVFADVAQTTADWIEQLAHHANSSELCAVCAGSN